MTSQLGRRTGDAFGYFGFAFIGAVVGWKLGLWIGGTEIGLAVRNQIGIGMPPSSADDLVRWKVAWRTGYGTVMSLFCIWQGTRMHDRHIAVKRLMRKHQLTFYQIRHLNPVSFFPLKVLTWASFYTIGDGFVAPLLGIVCGFVVAGMAGPGSDPWFLALLWIGGWAAGWIVADQIVHKLFSREDLEREIAEASLMIQAYSIAKEEERAVKEERRFWESDDSENLPPYR